MKKQSLAFTLIIFTTLLISALIVFFGLNSNNISDENTQSQITPTPTPTPQAKPLEIEAKVTPWGDMYRTESDVIEDFSVELVYPNQNETFTTNTFEVTINAGVYQ